MNGFRIIFKIPRSKLSSIFFVFILMKKNIGIDRWDQILNRRVKLFEFDPQPNKQTNK